MMTEPIPSHVRAGLQAGGDLHERQFVEQFLAYYPAIFRHLYRILGSQQEAEDLAQETFLRLHRQRFPQDEGSPHNVRAWLYRVATNLAYNALRGQERRERRQQAAAAEGSLAPDPAEQVQRREAREAVRRVLAALPERDAKLLLLRHSGLSYRELAQALDLATGSVGTLLARAHRAFEALYRQTVEVSEGEEDHGA
jgi:RNA polymerase sigma-70 factor (ECF subfamily)